MEQLKRVAVAMLAGLACTGGYSWLTSDSERGPGSGADGLMTRNAAAQRTERPAVAVTQAPQTLRNATPPSPPVVVDFRDDLLTVKAHGAPLGEVLAAITRSVGVVFYVSGDAGESLSIDVGPRPTKEVISRLLDRACCGYAFVDAARGAGRPRLAEVFLVKQGTGDGSGRVSARRELAPSVNSAPATIVEPSSRPDEAALQEQRAVDTLFDACRIQGCDTS
jgi:hypothetical protein